MFSKLKQRFKSAKKSNVPEHDLRVHMRYQIPKPLELATLSMENKNHTIKDISYGGLQVDSGSEGTEPLSREGIFATLNLLFEQRTVRLQPIYQRQNCLGLSFIHETSETLIFLRDVLEFIRIGKTFVAPPKGALKPSPPADRKQLRLLGEGNCFLTVEESEPESALALVHMGFKSSGVSQEILLRDGQIQTAIQTKSGTALDLEACIAPTRSVDMRMVRQALAISIGLNDKELGEKLRHELLVHMKACRQSLIA